MKKVLVFLAIIMIIIISNKEENIIIPESSIRFRVIANSNTLEDQTTKNKISKNLSSFVSNLIKETSSKEEATKVLNENYNTIDKYLKEYLNNNNLNLNYDLNIGKNYFEKKNYKGINYDAGYYDSLVLSLGNKQGVNWWCVMYPPLCLIDEDTEDVKYTTLVQDMLDKYKF